MIRRRHGAAASVRYLGVIAPGPEVQRSPFLLLQRLKDDTLRSIVPGDLQAPGHPWLIAINRREHFQRIHGVVVDEVQEQA